MKLDTAKQEVDNLQAQIAEASSEQPKILAFGSPQRLDDPSAVGPLDGGDGLVETATPAAAGAPDGGDQPDAAETATGAPGVGDGPVETAMPAAAGAPGRGWARC